MSRPARRGLMRQWAAGAIVSQGQKDIARTLGRLILDRHNIYLYADVLDAPDVCWENPDLDPLYRCADTALSAWSWLCSLFILTRHCQKRSPAPALSCVHVCRSHAQGRTRTRN